MARISADRLTVLPVFRRMAEATSSRKTARSFGKRTVIATVGSELTVLRTHLVPRAAPLNAGAEGARQAVDVTARRGSGSARQKSFLLTFFPLGDYLKMTHRTMARRRGRPPGLTEARISNRHILAAAVIAGIKIATVAKQLVVSRSWASREANAQGTRKIIAAELELHRGRLSEVFGEVLDAIWDALSARQYLVVNGVVVDAGPDHHVRLEAVKMFTRLMHHTSADRR